MGGGGGGKGVPLSKYQVQVQFIDFRSKQRLQSICRNNTRLLYKNESNKTGQIILKQDTINKIISEMLVELTKNFLNFINALIFMVSKLKSLT